MSKETLSSRLKERITLEYPVESADGAGGFSLVWTEFETVWAEVTPLNSGVYGREVFADAQLQPQLMPRFTIRTLENVTADMRIAYDGRTFNIRALRHPDPNKASLEILAEEGVAV